MFKRDIIISDVYITLILIGVGIRQYYDYMFNYSCKSFKQRVIKSLEDNAASNSGKDH